MWEYGLRLGKGLQREDRKDRRIRLVRYEQTYKCVGKDVKKNRAYVSVLHNP